MQKIIHYLAIKSPIEKVYDAVATIEGLSNWWSTNIIGSEKQGNIINFQFIPVFNPNMKITSLKRPHEVKWTCISGHDLWQDNKFTFEFSEDESSTKLKFVQEYVNPISEEDYGTYNFNWAFYLQSLKDYCSTGKGKPFEPDKD